MHEGEDATHRGGRHRGQPAAGVDRRRRRALLALGERAAAAQTPQEVQKTAEQVIRRLDLQTKLPTGPEPFRFSIKLPSEVLWLVIAVAIGVLLYAFRDMIPLLRWARTGAGALTSSGRDTQARTPRRRAAGRPTSLPQRGASSRPCMSCSCRPWPNPPAARRAVRRFRSPAASSCAARGSPTRAGRAARHRRPRRAHIFGQRPAALPTTWPAAQASRAHAGAGCAGAEQYETEPGKKVIAGRTVQGRLLIWIDRFVRKYGWHRLLRLSLLSLGVAIRIIGTIAE